MRVVNLSRDAEKSLRLVPQKRREQLAKKLLELSVEPLPSGATKLVDSNYWRMRVGEYRVVYCITEAAIDVVLLEKRDTVYKKLRRR